MPWSTRALVLAQPLAIRPVRAEDAAALAALDAARWREGLRAGEDRAPCWAELARPRAAAVGTRLPQLLALTGSGTLVGAAWTTPSRDPAIGQLAVEDLIYVHPEARGLRVGRRLLARLIEDCRAQGLRRMVAVLGERGHGASLALHYSLGFTAIGVLPGAARRPATAGDGDGDGVILLKQLGVAPLPPRCH